MKLGPVFISVGVGMVLVAIAAGFMSRPPAAPSCDAVLEALQAERIAREGKTDREFYEANR